MTLGKDSRGAERLPKGARCGACENELDPKAALCCAACGVVVCKGGERDPWRCFLVHCAAVGGDDTHRGKRAEVRDVAE